MYTLVIAVLLFPGIALAHGAHAPVGESLMHGILHSGEGIVGIVILSALVVRIACKNVQSKS